MNVIYGDIIQLAKSGVYDVVIHGCNCQMTMGAGVAKLIKKNFPAAYAADVDFPILSNWRLGTYSKAIVTILPSGSELTIVNAYTQLNYGSGFQIDYEAIQDCFIGIRKEFLDKKILYPKIGAGLGGGNWDIISTIIDKSLIGMDHTLVLNEA